MPAKTSWPWIAVAAVVGVAVGYWMPRSESAGDGGKHKAAEPGNTMAATKASSRSVETPMGPLEKLRHEIRTAEPAELPKLVYRSLELPQPLDRRMMLLETLRMADESNCRAIMNEFARITRETGRTHEDEWRLALFETGRKGGATMLNTWKAEGKNGNSTEMQRAIYGWASEDPRAAMAWLDSPENKDLPNKESLVTRVVAGAALTNAELAAEMMEELPDDQRIPAVGHFTWNLIQNAGLDGAVDWMLKVQSQPGAEKSAYAKRVKDVVLDKVLRAAEWTDGTPEMAERLIAIQSSMPIPEDRVIWYFQRLHGVAPLDLADRLVGTPVLADPDLEKRAVATAFTALSRESPESLRRWLANHPSSRIASEVEEQLDSQ